VHGIYYCGNNQLKKEFIWIRDQGRKWTEGTRTHGGSNLALVGLSRARFIKIDPKGSDCVNLPNHCEMPYALIVLISCKLVCVLLQMQDRHITTLVGVEYKYCIYTSIVLGLVASALFICCMCVMLCPQGFATD
jgi:hypothetical protein